MRSSPRLTSKQARFVREFAVDCNATRAAVRAGYATGTARQIGSENLSKPVVRSAIDAELKRHSKALDASVLTQNDAILSLLNADIADMFDRDGVPLPVSRWPKAFRTGLVESMKIRVEAANNGTPNIRIFSIQFVDRTKLIKELGRRLGAWTNRQPAASRGTASSDATACP